MGKLIHHDYTKIRDVEDGEPFIMHSRELLASDAWRTQSIHGRKLLNFLEIEHMNHAGTENGNLHATYKQLEAFGINSRFIPKAIKETEARGLITVERGARKSLNESFPNKFRLTYVKHYAVNPKNNCKYYYPPTNEWKRFHDS